MIWCVICRPSSLLTLYLSTTFWFNKTQVHPMFKAPWLFPDFADVNFERIFLKCLKNDWCSKSTLQPNWIIKVSPFRNNVSRIILDQLANIKAFIFWNREMSYQGNQSRYGKLYIADEEGNRRSFVWFINVSERKECPNCFVFFIKNDKLHCKHEDNGDLVSRFYVCPACGCRIKHHV